jgi:hypothetical protein
MKVIVGGILPLNFPPLLLPMLLGEHIFHLGNYKVRQNLRTENLTIEIVAGLKMESYTGIVIGKRTNYTAWKNSGTNKVY